MALELQSLKETALPILRGYGIERAGFYGSRVRGDHRPDSDLDVVVECPSGFSLWDLSGLRLDLCDTLGLDVGVTTYNALHPMMRDQILAEEQRVLG